MKPAFAEAAAELAEKNVSICLGTPGPILALMIFKGCPKCLRFTPICVLPSRNR